MLFNRLCKASRRLQGKPGLLSDLIDVGAEEGGDGGILTVADDPFVELLVVGREVLDGIGGADDGFLISEQAFQGADHPLCLRLLMISGQLHHTEAFQRAADLKGFQKVFFRHLVEAEAFAGDNVDVALLGQPLNGIAQRRPGNSQFLGNLCFRIDLTVLQMTFENHVFERFIGPDLKWFLVVHVKPPSMMAACPDR